MEEMNWGTDDIIILSGGSDDCTCTCACRSSSPTGSIIGEDLELLKPLPISAILKAAATSAVTYY